MAKCIAYSGFRMSLIFDTVMIHYQDILNWNRNIKIFSIFNKLPELSWISSMSSCKIKSRYVRQYTFRLYN